MYYKKWGAPESLWPKNKACDGLGRTRVLHLWLRTLPLASHRQGASRHQIGITYGIQPEDERKHFPKEKLPGCHGGYATDEEHHTLHDLSVVELTKAANE